MKNTKKIKLRLIIEFTIAWGLLSIKGGKHAPLYVSHATCHYILDNVTQFTHLYYYNYTNVILCIDICDFVRTSVRTISNHKQRKILD